MHRRLKLENRSTWLAASGAVLLWSTVATAFKIALRHSSPFELLFLSSAFSAVALVGICALGSRIREIVPRTASVWLRTLALALLNPFLYYAVLFTAYDRLPAQVAQPLNYTWAFVLAFLAVPMLGKQLRKVDIVGAVIAYGGVWVICLGASDLTPGGLSGLGVGLALGSTIIWAMYWILLSSDSRPISVALAAAFVVSVPLTAALAFASGMSFPTLPALASTAYVGLFEMGITFVLWGYAVRSAVRVARVASLIFLSPFLSLVFINFVLKEPVKLASVAGLGLIVAGLLVQRMKSKEPGKEAK